MLAGCVLADTPQTGTLKSHTVSQSRAEHAQFHRLIGLMLDNV